MRRVLCFFALVSLTAVASAQQSAWVHPNPAGKLIYAQTPKGDRIIDFSYAGYRGGGIALPDWSATLSVQPTGGDDTASIQAAIDKVSALPLDANGHRGAVYLVAGTFHCSATITIKASGVVLHGAGPVAAEHGTTLELTGQPHIGVSVVGEFHERVLGTPTTLTSNYVPSGGRLIQVVDASPIRPGDTLLLVKPNAPAWVKFMGMDALERPGRDEHWIGEDLKVRRRVVAVSGNMVQLDVPLTDDIDSTFLGGVAPPVMRVEDAGLISEVGVEDLSIVAPSRRIAYREDAEFDGIHADNAVDCWLRSLHFGDTTNSVRLEYGTARMTVKQVNVEQSKSVTSSAKNFQFSCNGTQILFDRCSGNGDGVMYFATQSRQQGPVVVLHSRFLGTGRIEPHQRWSTGLLVDGCFVPQGGISLDNRGTMGSGHGWTIGWSVLWNNTTSEIMVQMPPGAANWSIGDRGHQIGRSMPTSNGYHGADLPRGIVESPGKPVQPSSLYLTQLRERLGQAAVEAIGYGDDDKKLP